MHDELGLLDMTRHRTEFCLSIEHLAFAGRHRNTTPGFLRLSALVSTKLRKHRPRLRHFPLQQSVTLGNLIDIDSAGESNCFIAEFCYTRALSGRVSLRNDRMRKGGRVVECAGLEIQCWGLPNREFESHPFRQ